MRIELLGGFEVSEGDRTVPHGAWRLRKAKTLVKLLALEPAHRLHRDQLADQLWPDLDADAARNNLHQAMHAARRALSTVGVDGAAALAMRDDLVVLGPDGHVVTDLEEFQAAVDQANASRDGTALAAALGQWSGDAPPRGCLRAVGAATCRSHRGVAHHAGHEAGRGRLGRTGPAHRRGPAGARRRCQPAARAGAPGDDAGARGCGSPRRGTGAVRTAPHGAAAGARRGAGAADPSAVPGPVWQAAPRTAGRPTPHTLPRATNLPVAGHRAGRSPSANSRRPLESSPTPGCSP